MSELLTHQSEPHELLVLVTVADDHVVRVLGEAQNRLKLRLAAAFEPHSGRFAELDDLLHYVPLLIDFDRIHRRVSTSVGELLASVREFLVQRLDPRAEDVGKPQEQREAHPLRLQVVGQLEQIELPVRLLPVRSYDYMTSLVDVEKADPPPFDVVKSAGRFNRPRLDDLGRGRGMRVFRRRRNAGTGHDTILGHIAYEWYRPYESYWPSVTDKASRSSSPFSLACTNAARAADSDVPSRTRSVPVKRGIPTRISGEEHRGPRIPSRISQPAHRARLDSQLARSDATPTRQSG